MYGVGQGRYVVTAPRATAALPEAVTLAGLLTSDLALRFRWIGGAKFPSAGSAEGYTQSGDK